MKIGETLIKERPECLNMASNVSRADVSTTQEGRVQVSISVLYACSKDAMLFTWRPSIISPILLRCCSNWGPTGSPFQKTYVIGKLGIN